MSDEDRHPICPHCKFHNGRHHRLCHELASQTLPAAAIIPFRRSPLGRAATFHPNNDPDGPSAA